MVNIEHCGECEEPYCLLCGEGMIGECSKCHCRLCPDCWLPAWQTRYGVCGPCAAPLIEDDNDLYSDPRPIWERRLDG